MRSAKNQTEKLKIYHWREMHELLQREWLAVSQQCVNAIVHLHLPIGFLTPGLIAVQEPAINVGELGVAAVGRIHGPLPRHHAAVLGVNEQRNPRRAALKYRAPTRGIAAPRWRLPCAIPKIRSDPWAPPCGCRRWNRAGPHWCWREESPSLPPGNHWWNRKAARRHSGRRNRHCTQCESKENRPQASARRSSPNRGRLADTIAAGCSQARHRASPACATPPRRFSWWRRYELGRREGRCRSPVVASAGRASMLPSAPPRWRRRSCYRPWNGTLRNYWVWQRRQCICRWRRKTFHRQWAPCPWA